MLAHKDQLKKLALRLFEINAFKFGEFKMKIGINTPIYFDLRVIVSYPEVMKMVADLLVSYIQEKHISAKHVCGVPYTALPLATLVSVTQNLPMLIRRKETKDYGTKKLIEGIYSTGDTCLIVEDVVTSGSSIKETIRDLEREGLSCTEVVVLVDREQGGMKHVANMGVNTHALFTLSFLMQTLLEAGKVDQSIVEAVSKFQQSCQINADGSLVNAEIPISNEFKRTKLPFEKRAAVAKCEMARDLFNLMATKKTNLCLAADVTKCEDLLRLADQCGPYICVLKTHIDIVDDFNADFVRQLQQLAQKHNFLIMEDRKFADIGNTVSLQYGSGIYQIAEWAHLVTAHSLSGRSILQGLKAGISAAGSKRGVFLLAEMSASGNLIDDKYKEATNKIATEGTDIDFVAGIVSQSINSFAFPGLLQLTPGVNIDESNDSLGQQYNSPDHVVQQKGADIGVVGRGIYRAKNVQQAAALYRDKLWQAYEVRIGQI